MPFEPRPAASIRTVGIRFAPTHQAPDEPEDQTDVEDKSVDEEQVQAKVVSPRRRRSPDTTEDAETK